MSQCPVPDQRQLDRLFGAFLKENVAEWQAAFKREGYAVSNIIPIWHDGAPYYYQVNVARDLLNLQAELMSCVKLRVFPDWKDENLLYLDTIIYGPTGERWNPAYSTWAVRRDESAVLKMLGSINRKMLLEIVLEEIRKPGRMAPSSPKHWMPGKELR